tara:strand:+ start:37 stop:372 length:336 start_codon:yes stop_codon:yes gene_type:complete
VARVVLVRVKHGILIIKVDTIVLLIGITPVRGEGIFPSVVVADPVVQVVPDKGSVIRVDREPVVQAELVLLKIVLVIVAVVKVLEEMVILAIPEEHGENQFPVEVVVDSHF